MAVQDKELSAFLETFLDPLHHRQPESSCSLWVFWSKDEEEEGSQNNSSSADVATHRMFYDKIKSAFSIDSIDSIEVDYDNLFILQFWAPVTIDGRRLLSTSGQPFSVNNLDIDLAKYRLRSLEYPYNIDETNKLNIEPHPDMIVSGAASSAFLNRFPVRVNFFEEQSSLEDHYALESRLINSHLLPIFCPSQSNSCCVGVVECSTNLIPLEDLFILNEIETALEKVGLSVFHEQERIPYEIINDLESTRDEIKEALKIVCESHCISLAQVWISYKDEYHAPFSFSLEDTRKKRMFPIAFQETYAKDDDYSWNRLYLLTGEERFKKTFQDYEPRFRKNISLKNMAYAASDDKTGGSALVICLRSISTGHFDYAFEFIWRPKSKYLIFLEQLLLTLKRCLPSFKFASGAELGDELRVIDVDNSTSETRFFKIFLGKKVSPIPETLEKGKKQIVEDYLAHSKSKCKTTPILLSRQAIEEQFGNTMKEAAKNLSVSLSTLKRKCHGYGISEWQGPSLAKRKVNDSSNNQRDKNEEDNGAIQDPSAVNKNENTLIIKAEWEDDMIKFQLSISQATFETVEKEIGMQFNLTMGTYKLKYLDEDGDWILLKSDQDMSNCIKSSRKLDGTQVRLRVQQSTQPIPGPTGSYELWL